MMIKCHLSSFSGVKTMTVGLVTPSCCMGHEWLHGCRAGIVQLLVTELIIYFFPQTLNF